MFWIFAGFLLGIPAFVLLLLKYIDGGNSYWTKLGVFSIPNSHVSSLLSRLLFQTPFHTLDKLYYDSYKAAKVRFAGQTIFRHPALFILDLDLVKSILVKDFDHFVNRRVFEMGDADPGFDLMLLNQEGQEWKDLRAKMTPAFTTGKIKRMMGIFTTSSQKMVQFIQGQGQVDLDVRDVCGRYTMDVIASAAFGVESLNFEDKNSVFAQMGRRMQDNFKGILLLKVLILFLFPKLFRFFKFSLMDKKTMEFFEGVLLESIRRREKGGERREDFLQLMLDAKNDNTNDDMEELPILDKFENPGPKKSPITNEIILAQANLFFIAGFDVMETLLMFAAYELALHQDVQERLYEEISEALEISEGVLEYDVLVKLEYLDMVISETLRKYPAALRGERRCNLDYTVPNSDYTITKGTHVIIPIYGIHHDPEIYPEPDKFNPERFTVENKAGRHPYAYLPFGLGPRSCIAMRFALIEGKTAIAHLVHNFRIEPCSKTKIPMEFSRKGILKPEDGMWLKLISRE